MELNPVIRQLRQENQLLHADHEALIQTINAFTFMANQLAAKERQIAVMNAKIIAVQQENEAVRMDMEIMKKVGAADPTRVAASPRSFPDLHGDANSSRESVAVDGGKK